jgi:hypothetical protein
MSDPGLVQHINRDLGLAMSSHISLQELHEALSKHINWLIQNDFATLVNLLYRIDVDELKLKALLAENRDRDTASLLSDLIIERQQQKIASRKSFHGKQMPGDEEEKWESD